MFSSILKKNAWIGMILFVFVLAACAGQAPTATTVVVQEPTAILEEPTATLEEPTATAEEPTPTLEEPTAITEEPMATAAESGAEISFANDVFPILQNSCFKCHGGERTAEGLDVSSYDTLMAGSDGGVVIVAGDAENSKLFMLVNEGKMPKKASKLPDDQIELIRNWINAGALDN